MSWTLPPQDLLDADILPSVWRTYALARRLVLAAVLGQTTLAELTSATKPIHQRLAHSRRKRKPPIRYPVRKLS